MKSTGAFVLFWGAECIPDGWTDTTETVDQSPGTLTLRANRYVYFCPGCGRTGEALGRYVICCDLQIEPFYITREFQVRLVALDGQTNGEILEAMRLAARSGGIVDGGQAKERATAPKRVFP